MGNSNGTLAEYWDAIESTPGLQGGFIWEWWDHGLVQTLPDGTTALGLWRRLRRRAQRRQLLHRRPGLARPAGRSRRCGSTRRSPRRSAIAREPTDVAPRRGQDPQPPGLPRPRLAERPLRAGGRRRRRRTRATSRCRTSRPGEQRDRHDPRAGRAAGPTAGETLADRRASDGRRDGRGRRPGFEVARRPGAGSTRVRRGRTRPRRRAAAPTVARRRRRARLVHPLLARRPGPVAVARPDRQRPHRRDRPRAGRPRALDRLERHSSIDRARRRDATDRARRVPHGRRASRSPHEQRFTALERRRRSASTRPSSSRPSLTDLARIGTVLETVPGLETLEWFGTRPARDVPGSQARRAGRPLALDRHGRSTCPYIRPQENGGHADVRWLTLTDGDGPWPADRRSSEPRQVSATHHPRRRPRRRRRTTSSSRPRAETIVHLDVAHRGLGTASCGPDTLPSTSSDRAPTAGRWTLQPARARTAHDRSSGAPTTASSTSRNGRLSLVLRVYEDGSLGQLHLGAPLPTGRSYRHLGPDPFDGLLEPGRRAGPAGLPDAPGPATSASPRSWSARADGSTALTLRYRDHRIVAGKPALEPACRRPTSRTTTRPRRSRSRSPTSRRASRWTCGSRSSATGRSSPAAPRSATPAARPSELRLRDEPRRSTCPTPTGSCSGWPARGRASGTSSSGRLVHRPAVRLEHARRVERPAQPVPRAAPADDRRGARRGLRVQPRLLGQLPRRGRGRRRSARPGSGSASSPRRSPGASSPGESFTTPGGGRRLLGRRPRRPVRRVPRPASGSGWRAATWRDRPRPDPHQQLGGDLLRLRRRQARRDRRVGAATSASSCSSSTTAGSARATTTRPRSATGSSTGASCPTGSTASRERITALGIGFGIWIEPEMVSAESELFRAHPDWAIGVPGRPRTESRQQLVLDMAPPRGRRPPRPRSWRQILASAPITYVKWDMNRNITEPWTAVAARPTGRASSSTATSSACTSCTGG